MQIKNCKCNTTSWNKKLIDGREIHFCKECNTQYRNEEQERREKVERAKDDLIDFADTLVRASAIGYLMYHGLHGMAVTVVMFNIIYFLKRIEKKL